MGNKKLGEMAIQEIRNSMRDLVGKPAKEMAVRMADIHGIGWQRIYELTKDLRPERKKRADAGKRTYQMVEGTDVWKAAQFVIADKLDPDQALLTCKTRGLTNVPSLGYFQSMLREKGLGRKARRNPTRAFRNFEAENPGELFQIDVTALKVRWQDEKTRRILRIEGVDKNHPQMDETKLRVWQILLKDDFSRQPFLRYVVTRAVTSTEMLRFMSEVFDKLCVPQMVYTDQGGEFKSRFKKIEKLFNAIPEIRDTGGFRHLAHAPGNPQATGKVESGHQWAEKMDRYVGLAISEGQTVTIDDLNVFAERVCEAYGNRIHRATGEAPMARWHSKRVVLRRLPTEVIESALLTEEFTVRLDPSMTVARNGVAYKVPGVQPFVDYIGQKVKVVVPPSIDMILLALPNGAEYELEKVVATADKAGEFRSTADSTAETLKKRLRQTSKEDKKAAKQKLKQTGEILPVPHYNVVIEQPASNVSRFPHPERVVAFEEVNKVVPIPFSPVAAASPDGVIHSPAYEGRDIGYWEAVAEFSSQFENVDETKNFMLTLFPGTSGTKAFAAVEDAVKRRHDRTEFRSPLRAVS